MCRDHFEGGNPLQSYIMIIIIIIIIIIIYYLILFIIHINVIHDTTFVSH